MSDMLHDANGAKFVAQDDMIVAWERAEARPFEPKTTAFLLDALVARRGVLIDAGASTGWFAIPAAMRGADVIGFEPFAAARARLRENALINGVEIELRPEALGARRGRATFWRNPRVRLTSGGSIARPGCAGPVAETVEVVALDDLDLPRVAVIKLDVEGAEIEALDGARETILRDRPHLAIEANTAEERARRLEWFSALGGYDLRDADDRNLLASPRG